MDGLRKKAGEKEAHLSIEVLRDLLDCNFSTGKLTWRKRKRKWFSSHDAMIHWNGRWAGKPALDATDGRYKVGSILCTRLVAHRVIWALHSGSWPSLQIDHINGNGLDNRILNLREVDASGNMRNAKRRRNNVSGVAGVSFHNKRQHWTAAIGHHGKTIFLGQFQTKEEAIAARRAAEPIYGYHPNHGRAA